jgi:hypothetical protein
MRELVLTPKFKRAFRKFVRRDTRLQKRIEDTLQQMQEDVFAANLNTTNSAENCLDYKRVLVAMIVGLCFQLSEIRPREKRLLSCLM